MKQDDTSMFKLYDIRAKYHTLSSDTILRIISAIARYYKDILEIKTVYIGRDARLYCAELMDKMLEILPQYGIDVIFNPVQISTCQFYYSCMVNRSCGGIMITSSHNPADYIGFKMIGADMVPIAMGCGPQGGIEKIKSFFLEDLPVPENDTPGSIRVEQYQKEYVDYSMRLAGVHPGDLKGLKVFAEFLSGTAGTDFAMAMNSAGAEITLNHPVPDGRFLQGDPNPLVESSVSAARDKMRRGKYDIGFCYDGDGDRMDLMFCDGTQILPGFVMSVLIKYIQEVFSSEPESGFKIYSDLKAAPPALICIRSAGAEPHIIRNGHSFIKEKLRNNLDKGYFAAEEESAHYYMNFPYDPDDYSKGFAATENTLFFSLIAARAFNENPDAFNRLFQIQHKMERCREWPVYFECDDDIPRVLKEVETRLTESGAASIHMMDDGDDLDATLILFNLPASLSSDSDLPEKWCQVTQRASRSEDRIARWEVTASDEETCNGIKNIILSVTNKYVSAGLASYEK